MRSPPEGQEVHSIVYSETYTQWVRADGISVISVHNDYGQTKPPEGELVCLHHHRQLVFVRIAAGRIACLLGI